MPVEMGLWLVDDKPTKLQPIGMPTEKRLEELIESDPDILGEYLQLLAAPNLSRDNEGVRKNARMVAAMFEKRGVGLFVYNPRSLLSETLPLWSPSAS